MLCITFSHEYEVLIFFCQENHIWEQQMTQSCKATIIHKLYNIELNFVKLVCQGVLKKLIPYQFCSVLKLGFIAVDM